VNTSAESLEWLLRPSSSDNSINRKALAGLLLELAWNVEPELSSKSNGVVPIDPRLLQLRSLLLGREIKELSRLSELIEDPEQFALVMGRALPAALAQASSDERLGQVLAPTLEKATQTSIKSDPRTLVNILYPLIVPAIRKSIGEMVDETFQSLNESLKHSLTWRGLKWRWEAWRTGSSFAEVVLRHTLVYQVEHVFLIHRHTGLLISHIAAENAASEDPQLVSSMLTAIQDFVRDSFKGADERGLDTLRLGDLRLWSEIGPFASLVAVIRGNPPEGLHDTLRSVLSRIHAERPQALENFDGDSSGLTDVEALLTGCVELKQHAQPNQRRDFPWLVASVGLILMLLLGAWCIQWWLGERIWEGYVARLRAQPGIVITEVGSTDGKYLVAGLRDPLAADPQVLLREAGMDPAQVVTRWQLYQGLYPEFVMKRLQASLDPPPTVTLALDGDSIVARGSAPSSWIERARAASAMLPVGGPVFNISGLRDINDSAFGTLRANIQSRSIRFNNNESLPAPGQEQVLDQLAVQLRELASLSASLRATTRVTLTGHSDAIGRETFNLSLSLARAEAVRALLGRRGVDPDLIAVRGAGPLEPVEVESSEDARSVNRRVSLTVGIE
jgi:outer membrane protein OmpA-like peptidoglycan-associated protein